MEVGREGPNARGRAAGLQLPAHGHTGRKLKQHLLHTRAKTSARATGFSHKLARSCIKSFFFHLGALLLHLFSITDVWQTHHM